MKPIWKTEEISSGLHMFDYFWTKFYEYPVPAEGAYHMFFYLGYDFLAFDAFVHVDPKKTISASP